MIVRNINDKEVLETTYRAHGIDKTMSNFLESKNIVPDLRSYILFASVKKDINFFEAINTLTTLSLVIGFWVFQN